MKANVHMKLYANKKCYQVVFIAYLISDLSVKAKALASFKYLHFKAAQHPILDLKCKPFLRTVRMTSYHES
jgi:hypothetical protein